MKMTLPLLLAAFCCAAPVFAEMSSPRPMPRPEVDAPRKGFLSKLLGTSKPVTAGSVCNDPAIQGAMIAKINGKIKGCGIQNPVRVTAVDGIALSIPATLDCDTARALRSWVSEEAKPAFAGKTLVGLRVAGHYTCRTRNSKKGARISEHGRGKAIDIAGFQLKNGTEVSVLKHYKTRKGTPIRAAHKAACGIFGTTLGPGSDGHHMDHLHLDTASYRGGPYCK
ncbi:extensin family protein [Pseudorhodobacter turbinis]|uniref:Extensin family protein n=1 Tax=Pseudorhodobacter turbinis TaxID=2500533 RepID=A0A4P8EGT8_9RHOB|nr:extensin family protein [Pseudorhodobacter turbinis]QCO56371.1 extensin family protein [Pseudorhodobacter turbinis]